MDSQESKLVDASQPDNRRADFRDIAEKRYAEIVETGRTIPWSDMCRYLEDRISAKNPSRPKAITPARSVK